MRMTNRKTKHNCGTYDIRFELVSEKLDAFMCASTSSGCERLYSNPVQWSPENRRRSNAEAAQGVIHFRQGETGRKGSPTTTSGGVASPRLGFGGVG